MWYVERIAGYQLATILPRALILTGTNEYALANCLILSSVTLAGLWEVGAESVRIGEMSDDGVEFFVIREPDMRLFF